MITEYLHIISPEPCCKKGQHTLVTISELQKVFRLLTLLLVIQNSTEVIPDLARDIIRLQRYKTKYFWLHLSNEVCPESSEKEREQIE